MVEVEAKSVVMILSHLGHSDEGAGVAVLPGTDVTRRLMCSGSKRREDGILLVKAEWDAADAWLEGAEMRRQSN